MQQSAVSRNSRPKNWDIFLYFGLFPSFISIFLFYSILLTINLSSSILITVHTYRSHLWTICWPLPLSSQECHLLPRSRLSPRTEHLWLGAECAGDGGREQNTDFSAQPARYHRAGCTGCPKAWLSWKLPLQQALLASLRFWVSVYFSPASERPWQVSCCWAV